MKLSRLVVLLVPALLLANPVAADELAKARENITARYTEIKPENIQPSPLPGLYQVMVPPQVFYMSGDGKYAFDGDIIDLNSQANLTQAHRAQSRLGAVNEMRDSMIVFAPDKPKHTVTVFTDIDCGYCRRLHHAVAEYNKLGITIQYLAYPRSPAGSESYKKSVSAWCADDRAAAITAAKNGEKIADKTCDNPVAKHVELGNVIGITGTPALILENGQVIPGFVPPQQLSAMLEGQPQR